MQDTTLAAISALLSVDPTVTSDQRTAVDQFLRNGCKVAESNSDDLISANVAAHELGISRRTLERKIERQELHQVWITDHTYKLLRREIDAIKNNATLKPKKRAA